MPRIAKVKYKDGQVIIVERAGEGTTAESETTHKIYATPHPDFLSAMDELVKAVREILEWSSSQYETRIRVTGVTWSFSEGTGVEGAVITGLVGLEECDSPFSFNTPHMPFEQYSEGGASKLMPGHVVDMLEAFRTEANAYLHKGKRSQADLFDTRTDDKPIFDNTPGGLTDAVVHVVGGVVDRALNENSPAAQ